jgi:hypothetical protein
VNGTILLNSGENIITDNYFTFAPTTGPNVNETGGGGASYYEQQQPSVHEQDRRRPHRGSDPPSWKRIDHSGDDRRCRERLRRRDGGQTASSSGIGIHTVWRW